MSTTQPLPTSAGMDVAGDEDIPRDGGKTFLHGIWSFRPRGILRCYGPRTAWAGRHPERQVWIRMKQCLESV
jgi:hypothetical protein